MFCTKHIIINYVAGVVSFVVISLNLFEIAVPSGVIANITTIAIKAIIRTYSTMPCPLLFFRLHIMLKYELYNFVKAISSLQFYFKHILCILVLSTTTYGCSKFTKPVAILFSIGVKLLLLMPCNES